MLENILNKRTRKESHCDPIVSDKIDFRLKQMRRGKERNFVLNKGLINQEDIAILNLHTPTTGMPNFLKSMLMNLKTQIYSDSLKVGDLNIPLFLIVWLSGQK